MILEHTIKYEAVKMTCKEICDGLRMFSGSFYDPRDKEISKFDCDTWPWLFHQRPNKILYLLTEIKETKTLKS